MSTLPLAQHFTARTYGVIERTMLDFLTDSYWGDPAMLDALAAEVDEEWNGAFDDAARRAFIPQCTQFLRHCAEQKRQRAAANEKGTDL